MPRLSPQRYSQRHSLLRKVWKYRRQFFTLLTPTEQLRLFDYYVPHRDLTEAELREHRRGISQSRPSLPHQAGKTFQKFLGHLFVLRDLELSGSVQPEAASVQAYARSRGIRLALLVIAMAQHP